MEPSKIEEAPQTSQSVARTEPNSVNGNSRRETMGHKTMTADENKRRTSAQTQNSSYNGAGCENRGRQQDLHNPAEQLHSNTQNGSPHITAILKPNRSPLRQTQPNDSMSLCKTPQKLTNSKTGSRPTVVTKQNGSLWSDNKFECTAEQSVGRGRILKSTKKSNFSNRIIPVDNKAQMDPGVQTSTKKIPFFDSYPQPPFYPLQQWPTDLDSQFTSSAQEFGVQAPAPEPTSPVSSEKDCSFMTYSSDGISVIISNGNSDYQHGMQTTESFAHDRVLEQLERKMSVEMSLKDESEVKPPSVYVQNGSCQNLQFSISPQLPKSISLQCRTESMSSTRCLSSLFCDQSPPPAGSAVMADTITSSPVMKLSYMSPPPNVCSSVSSITLLNSPVDCEDEWLWFPAVISPMRLLLRWVYFPAPPPNLPCREPNISPYEKPVQIAQYYLSCHPFDSNNVQCVQGNWTHEQYRWKWLPPGSTNENIGNFHCYELPTPPRPAKGAWYLVWPAELPMSICPFIPGDGMWSTGKSLSKSNQPNAIPLSSCPITLYC